MRHSRPAILKYALLALALVVGGLLPETATSAAAQGNIKTYKRNGLDYYARGRFANAAEALKVYRRYEPDDDDVWMPLALSHFNLNELAEARTLLEGLIRARRKADPEAYLALARIEHHEARFEQAAARYKEFLARAGTKHQLYAAVVDDIRRAGNGLRMGPPTGPLAAYAENVGEGVNGPGDDYHPVLSPNYADRIYFTSLQEGTTGGRRNSDGQPDPNGELSSDMYVSRFVDGRWAAAQQMSALLNGPDFDEVLDFALDGQVLLMWKGPTAFSGDIHVDTFVADATQRRLYSPIWTASPLQTRRGDKDPILYNDTILLFGSARAGGYGGMDLYSSVRRAGVWSTPRNLGPRVNSAYDERTPFLARDGRTLFWSSNRADASVGGFDVFRAGYDDRKAEWSAPTNVGLSINSAGDELSFRLSGSGLEGFYDSSVRTSSLGGRDIFVAYFKERQREQSVTSEPLTFLQAIDEAERARVVAQSILDAPGARPLEPGMGSGAARARIPVAVTLAPLSYGKDDNVVTSANLIKAAPVIQFLEKYPSSRLVITTHSDASDPDRFRAYFGIKRAERLAAYLVERGIAPERLQLVSVGAAYPVAANEYNGQESAQGQRANRRLELQVVTTPEYELARDYADEKVPDFLALDAFEVYRELQRGSTFRIEVASLPQMYDSDAYLRLASPIITAVGTGGTYRYEVGTFATYRSAEAYAKELRGKGFPNARVVAYYDGLRLDARDLATYAPLDPELSGMHAAQPASE